MKRSLCRLALVVWTTSSLIMSPLYAQAGQQQSQPPAQTQSTTPQAANPQPIAPQAQSAESTATGPVATKRLIVGGNYFHGREWFPDIFAPYSPRHVEPPVLTNTPKIQQLIQDGKLMLSLDDAIALALENNLDIRVQRYGPWIAQTQLLKARAGGIPQPSSAQQIELGLPPSVSFDPVLTSQVNWSRSFVPLNQLFQIVGANGSTHLSTVPFEVTAESANYNFGYTQGFHTGTSISVQWQNNRGSNNLTGSYLFSPFVQSTLSVGFSQPLLNGCCRLPNTRYIIEAKNSLKVSAAQFDQAVMGDIVTTSTDYWELVYDREFVKVEEQAVAVSQKLYEDNKKQLEIGTMAPLSVITAESQLATDKSNLVVAQANQLLQQAKLLNDITKNPMDPSLLSIEIVPTTPISTPEVVENVPLNDLMNEAWKKRPEMTVDELTLVNDKIEVRATRNSLLPTLSIFGQYQGVGLAGVNQALVAASATGAIVPSPTLAPQLLPSIPAAAPGALGPQVSPAIPIPYATTTAGAAQTGVPTALNNMINASSPTYLGGLTFSMPIRNRSAQADNARAQLSERQTEVAYQQLKNTILLNVRQAQIALQQDRAAVTAAEEAVNLAQQVLNSTQKQYQLGSTDAYTVVLRARDVTNAQSAALRNRISLIEALVQFNQAMGRTLEVNNITVADAVHGKVSRTPNIPGALDADSDQPASHDTWTPGKK